MCGRYAITLPPEAIRQIFETRGELPNWPTYYNAPPTTALPVIRQAKDANNRELALMQWGLVPWFSKDGKPSYSTINARAEGIRTAASYREPFSKGRRCLVPASGYFEWTGPKNDRQPHYFTRADGQPLALAGLWVAFPFVYLGLIVGSAAFSATSLLTEWLLQDVIYRIAVGCLAGVAIGWLLGRLLFTIPGGNVLADTGSGVLALAGVLLCYGATELLEGYGFISCFVAGLTLRRVEADHQFHVRLHSFNEAIELALTALLLVLIGGVFPLLWAELEWIHAGIVVALLLIIRPVSGWFCLGGTNLRMKERLVVAFYGVRGIGSIYYLAFATTHLEFVNEGQLWATIALTILISTIIHGLTAGFVVDHVAREPPGKVH